MSSCFLFCSAKKRVDIGLLSQWVSRFILRMIMSIAIPGCDWLEVPTIYKVYNYKAYTYKASIIYNNYKAYTYKAYTYKGISIDHEFPNRFPVDICRSCLGCCVVDQQRGFTGAEATEVTESGALGKKGPSELRETPGDVNVASD